MKCWYCHWGWSAAVADIYERYLPLAGESAMHYGPAHSVWEDENFERQQVQWCLDAFKDYRPADFQEEDQTAEALALVKQSLEELLALPDEVRCPTPEDYDGQHPEQFPPTVPMRRPRSGLNVAALNSLFVGRAETFILGPGQTLLRVDGTKTERVE